MHRTAGTMHSSSTLMWGYSRSYGITFINRKLTLTRSGVPSSTPTYTVTPSRINCRLQCIGACLRSTPIRLSMFAGKMDHVKMAQVLAVQEWLMDEERCPTKRPVLLRIRRANPCFHDGARPVTYH